VEAGLWPARRSAAPGARPRRVRGQGFRGLPSAQGEQALRAQAVRVGLQRRHARVAVPRRHRARLRAWRRLRPGHNKDHVTQLNSLTVRLAFFCTPSSRPASAPLHKRMRRPDQRFMQESGCAQRGRAAARLYVDAQNAAAPRGRAQRLTRNLQPAAGRAAEHQHAAACGAKAVWQRTQGALALPQIVSNYISHSQ